VNQEEIAKIKADATAAALVAMQAQAKAEADLKAKLEAEKAAKEAERKALKDEILTEIMGGVQGHRSTPAQPTDVQVGAPAFEKHKGLAFVRFIKAKAASELDRKPILDVVKGWNERSPGMGYGEFAKALSSGAFAGMGSMVRPEWSGDFIELLRNKSVVRKAGARAISGGQRLQFDGQAAAGTAYWVGETTAVTNSNPTTSQPLALTAKKLAAQCPVPNDLIRNASISADQFVLNDLLQVVALEEDLQFLYGPGTSGKPRGIALQLASSMKYAMTALGVAGKPTVLEMKQEIDKALKKMELANAPMDDVAIFTSPSPKAAILDAVASSGDGSNMLENEWNARGTIRGKKFFITNQISETGGLTLANGETSNSNGQSDLLFFDMSEVIILDAMSVEAEVFPNGAYTNNSGTVVSGISTDQTVIRLLKEVDIGLRHNVSGARVYNVTWGN